MLFDNKCKRDPFQRQWLVFTHFSSVRRSIQGTNEHVLSNLTFYRHSIKRLLSNMSGFCFHTVKWNFFSGKVILFLNDKIIEPFGHEPPFTAKHSVSCYINIHYTVHSIERQPPSYGLISLKY